MLRALRAELLKLKGSAMVRWTLVSAALIPLIDVLLMMRTTRELDVRVDWEEFMVMGNSQLAGMGLMLFGLIAAYVFAREYADGSTTELFTTPIRRESVMLAKGIVVLGWVLALSVLMIAAHAGYGVLLGAENASWQVTAERGVDAARIVVLLLATLPVVAFIAIRDRGYLAPMSFSAAMMICGTGMALAGRTRWFPWSMPVAEAGGAMFLPMAQARMESLVPGSWVLMGLLFVAASAALVLYVDRADAPGRA